MRSAFIYSDKFSRFSYPASHPFDLKRSDRLYKVLNDHKLLNGSWITVAEPTEVPENLLFKAHDEEYIKLLKMANEGQVSLEMLEHGLGTEDCPIMKGIFDLHMLAAGATLKAVKMVQEYSSYTMPAGYTDEGVRFSLNPMGGFHHAQRSRAGGFCYINDVVIAIYHLLRKEKRVAYVDLDAHHGDGVQNAFYHDDRVLYISMHESGKYLFPGTGFETEIGEGMGRGYNINVPLETGTDDEVYFYAFNEIVPPLFKAYQPDFVIVLMGADVLSNDPVAGLHMTNNVMADMAVILDNISTRWVCLGAGGYNLENTIRAWARIWAVVNGFETQEDDLATLGGVFLGDTGIGVQGLRDMYAHVTGPEKDQAYKEVDRVIGYIKENVFPIIGAR